MDRVENFGIEQRNFLKRVFPMKIFVKLTMTIGYEQRNNTRANNSSFKKGQGH